MLADATALTPQRLRELLHYDLTTGVFTWMDRPGKWNRKPGQECGYLSNNGYVRIKVLGKEYAAHHLAWFYVHGKWPTHQIDHIDGNRTHNFISNLREATNSQNCQNQRTPRSTNPYIGVHWHSQSGMWRARIRSDGKEIHLGLFHDPAEAYQAYLTAKRKYHPYGAL